MTEPARRNIAIALPSTGEEEWLALRESIESGWLSQGPKVAAFEKAFAVRHQVGHALATTSCTTALHLALAALNIGPGDQVIVPAFTWVATANVVIYCGATPVFVDVDPITYNMDMALLASSITSHTKAIIPVHLFGLCADIPALRSLVPEGIAIVEDAACAAGATIDGQPAGGLGTMACFSFHPRKSITTGEGGMLTTDDSDLAEVANRLRNHGASVSEEIRHHGPKPYLLPDFDVLGFNYRMSDLQGALGLVQLGKLDRFLAERDKWARWYCDELADIEWLQMPSVPAGYGHAWQAFVTVVDEASAPAPRNDIMETLQTAGVSTRPGTHAVTELGYYKDRLGLQSGQFKVASRLERQTLALPLHNRMSAEDFAYVSETLHRI